MIITHCRATIGYNSAMRAKLSGEFAGSLLRQLKRLAYSLAEKQPITLEEYTLQHFLVYHGLVGSSPPDQPEFRLVREDIIQAFEAKSSTGMSTALKLPPLWWEDKLKSVFAELKTRDRQLTIDLLLPAADGAEPLYSEANPLKSEQWEVRANASNLLSFLEATEAVSRMAESLDQCRQGELKAAFCHVAFALARLGSEQARLALAKYLIDEELWFRVDAARSLSLWPLDAVAQDLSTAVLAHHELSDYAAVAIAENHPPLSFLQRHEQICREAAFEMIIEILKAASKADQPSIVMETGVCSCGPDLFRLAPGERGPRRVRAILSLAEYFVQCDPQTLERLAACAPSAANGADEPAPSRVDPAQLVSQAQDAVAALTGETVKESVLQRLSSFRLSDADEQGEMRHVIWLSGRLGVAQSVSFLKQMLVLKYAYINDAIETLGLLGDPQAAQQLVKLARETVDMEERKTRARAAQPVDEPDRPAARRYWLIIKALGNIPDREGLDFLLEASEDYAPDKREQALTSLVSAYSRLKPDNIEPLVHKAIERGLKDRSSTVKIAALDAVVRLETLDLIPLVVKQANVKLSSVSRKAISVMTELAGRGNREAVENAVRAHLKTEFAPNKKKKLKEFLRTIS